MRRTRVNPINKKRRKRELDRQFGALAEYVRGLSCCVKGCIRWAEPAHVHTRRNAGAWRETPDGWAVGNIAPLCHWHHREQHAIGVSSFGSKYDLDLEEVAERVGLDFIARDGDTGLAPF